MLFFFSPMSTEVCFICCAISLSMSWSFSFGVSTVVSEVVAVTLVANCGRLRLRFSICRRIITKIWDIQVPEWCHIGKTRICLFSARKPPLTKSASVWAAPVYWQWRRITKLSCSNFTNMTKYLPYPQGISVRYRIKTKRKTILDNPKQLVSCLYVLLRQRPYTTVIQHIDTGTSSPNNAPFCHASFLRKRGGCRRTCSP